MNEYHRLLSASNQRCYNEIVEYIESYQTEWLFCDMSFAFVSEVYKSFLDNHPEYFWLSYECNGTTKTGNGKSVLTFRPKFEFPISQISDIRRIFDKAVDALVNKAKNTAASLYEQILYLHDYLVLHTDYVLNAAHCYDAYGCLVQHNAVCAGYAAAFQVLMNKIGIQCGRTSGWSRSNLTGEVSHVWNYVKLSDGYYYIDVTWDDPIVSYGTTQDNLSHDYFCLDYNELRLTHKFESNQFIPQDFGKRYNYYQYRGWFLDRYSFSELQSLAIRQLQHANRFVVKFNTKVEADKAINDLIENKRVFSIPGLNSRISYSTSKSGLILKVSIK